MLQKHPSIFRTCEGDESHNNLDLRSPEGYFDDKGATSWFWTVGWKGLHEGYKFGTLAQAGH